VALSSESFKLLWIEKRVDDVHGTGIFASLVGVVVCVGEFVERFDDGFAEEEETMVVT